MREKILFIYPVNTIQGPRSGEIEARCLRTGFQLAGYTTDIFGFEQSSIEDYQIFVVFTCTSESIQLISNLPQQSRVILIPYLDDFQTFPHSDIKELKNQQIFVYSRSAHENMTLANLLPEKAIIPGSQWFLAPFARNTDANIDISNRTPKNGFIAMAEPSRSDHISALSEIGKISLYSDATIDQWRMLSRVRFDQVELHRRFPYGTSDWLNLLNARSPLFEPNDRITASVLEKLYLGGRVIVSKNNCANSELAAFCTHTTLSSEFIEFNLDNLDSLLTYHSDFIARKILKHIGCARH